MAQKKFNKTEITFKQLCDFVANIDYIDNSSYPIKFSVVTKDENSVTSFFEAGIGNSEDETDQQYLGRLDVDNEKFFVNNEGAMEIMDVQDPDTMSFDNIVLLLADRCKITPNSKIYLYNDISFNGGEYPCELACEKTSNGQYAYYDSIPFGDLIDELRQNNDFETLKKLFNVFSPNKKLIENINPRIYSHFLYCLIAMFIAETKRRSYNNPMAIQYIFLCHHEKLSDECLSDMKSLIEDWFDSYVLPSKQTWNNFIKRNLK